MRAALEKRKIGATIKTFWMFCPCDIKNGRQKIDCGYHVLRINAAGFGDPRPTNHPRRMGAVMIELCLGER